MVIDGYVRVSEVKGRSGDSFISPTVQREQIQRWVHARDATIGMVFEELDQSGAKADRPMLSAMLARVEEGETDGVVVASFDRLGRSLVDNLTAIERIHAAGAAFVSLREGLDLTTDTGKLVLRIMLSMGEWELDRVRARWNAARRRAVRRGVHMGPHAPTGYTRDSNYALHPDPLTGPVVTEAFRRRASGATIRSLCEFFAEKGVETPVARHRWQPAAMHRLIGNRVYVGELHHGAMSNWLSHPPLTDQVTWTAAQKPRVVARSHSRKLPTVLDGLVRCAGCRMLMRSQTVTTRAGVRKRIYYCGRRFAAGECSSPAWISASVADPYVDATFFALAQPRGSATERPASPRRLIEAHERASQDVVEYRDSPAIRLSLDEARFAAGLAERERRERHAALAIAAQRAKGRTALIPAAEELEAGWHSRSLHARRTAMGELIDCVFIARRESATPRIFVCARGDAPVDLPRRGGRASALSSFEPGDTPRAEPSVLAEAWSDQRIAVELAAFLAGRTETTWPSEEEFIFAGRGPLLRQINQAGGPIRWGRETSLRPRRTEWTDERIRTALDVVLAGRTIWPSRSEFEALDLGGLYAVLAHRGRRKWAEEYGLEYRNTGGAAQRWTEARVAATVSQLCAGRETYPSSSEFAAAGLAGLHLAIARRHGGHDLWAAKVGLPRRADSRTARPSKAA